MAGNRSARQLIPASGSGVLNTATGVTPRAANAMAKSAAPRYGSTRIAFLSIASYFHRADLDGHGPRRRPGKGRRLRSGDESVRVDRVGSLIGETSWA